MSEHITYDELCENAPQIFTVEQHQSHGDSGVVLVSAHPSMNAVAVKPGTQLNYDYTPEHGVTGYSVGHDDSNFEPADVADSSAPEVEMIEDREAVAPRREDEGFDEDGDPVLTPTEPVDQDDEDDEDEDFSCPEDGCDFEGKNARSLAAHSRSHS